MSYDDVDEQDEYGDDSAQEPGNWRRTLEKRAKKAESKASDLEQQIAALQRENAFAKAGVPLSDKKAAYFLKGYDGELDPEAIRKEAIEFGLIAAPQEQEQPEVPVEEQQAHQRMQQLAAGQAPGASGDFHAQLAATRSMSRDEGRAAVLALAAQHGMPVANVQ